MQYAQVQRCGDVEETAVVDGGDHNFVAEAIVDATSVVAVMSEEEEIERRRGCVRLGFLALLAVAASAIAVGVKLAGGNPVTVATVAGSTRTPADPSPTPAPTDGTFPRIIEVLRPVSGDDLTREGTPANMALNWIANRDGVGRDPSDPRFVQRYVLAVFYYATGGDDWRTCSVGAKLCGIPNKDNFLSESDECDWFGNDCRDVGVIVEIAHGTTIGNNLVGTLPRELAWLPDLESLFVQNNHLHHTIPTEFGRLSKFHTLVASNNRLESPFPHSILDNGLMEMISVENNRFGGEFPSMANQTKLKILSVQGNSFTGQIEPNFGQLITLEALELSQNLLKGTVPEAIASMASLESFLVDGNQLSGSFPSSIFAMGTLRQLNVTDNELTGTLPSPEIGGLGSALAGRHRKFVNLANNRFSGSVPSEVAGISYLKELTLHGNDFAGPMPSTVCALKTGTSENSYSLTLLTSDCGEVDCNCSEVCTCY